MIVGLLGTVEVSRDDLSSSHNLRQRESIKNRQIRHWKIEESHPHSGCDFSHLDGRWIAEDPPWSYESRVRELLSAAGSVLDLGTGDGERLAGLADHLPKNVVATEGHPPNLRLALERLGSLGIQVVEVGSSLEQELPFEDGSFDLVISRHTAFHIVEVERVLAPGGTFLTQQVDGRNLWDLSEAFGYEQRWAFYNLEYVSKVLNENTHLTIEQAEEWSGRSVFKDVGAIIYYLKAVPWTVPDDFSVEKYIENLNRLQQHVSNEGELVFEQKLFLLKASKLIEN